MPSSAMQYHLAAHSLQPPVQMEVAPSQMTYSYQGPQMTQSSTLPPSYATLPPVYMTSASPIPATTIEYPLGNPMPVANRVLPPVYMTAPMSEVQHAPATTMPPPEAPVSYGAPQTYVGQPQTTYAAPPTVYGAPPMEPVAVPPGAQPQYTASQTMYAQPPTVYNAQPMTVQAGGGQDTYGQQADAASAQQEYPAGVTA